MEAKVKTKRVELLAPTRPRHQGNQPRFLKLRKVSVEVELSESGEREIENLLLFDASCMDKQTRRELLQLLPALVHNSRAWRARFAEYGCLICKRKKVPYGSGGFCGRCQVRELHRMQNWYRVTNRDTTDEMWSIVRKLNAAQALLNGDDEDEYDLSSAMQKRLTRTAKQVGC